MKIRELCVAIVADIKQSGIVRNDRLKYAIEEVSKLLNAAFKEHIITDISARKGTYIGMLERLLVVILVVKGAYTAIAFVGALKTLTRFKQFDEKDFAEEYLIGTMTSALFAIICGHIIMKII